MLFTGIMMTPSGPRVLEYNVRFGDPETQSMVMLLAPDADLADILLACCMGQLASVSIPLRPGYACNVVVAADGYPGEYDTNIPIEIGACPEGNIFISRWQHVLTCLGNTRCLHFPCRDQMGW